MGSRKVAVRREFGSLTSDTRLPDPAPFLKWAGGKSQLLPKIERFLPRDYEVYFEPFLGGGAVFFNLRPERAVLSDLNPELVHLYQTVRDDPDGLMAALDEHHPRRKESEYYYKIRARDPTRLGAAPRAARTVFLNKTCFNGLYRVNAKGQFNVPFGRYQNPTLYERENLEACSRALRGAIIALGDYRNICRFAREGDFAYLDPPYQPVSPTASFTAYTKDAFDESDQKELSYVFSELDSRGCKVMLSNSATEFIESLYGGYKIERVTAMRAINSKGSGRGPVQELLIMNDFE